MEKICSLGEAKTILTQDRSLLMVPFIVWFGAAIHWLFVVGEATIAAPLWAITHLGGDDMGHTA